MKNIQNIQEAVKSQQAYMMVLSSHINTLYTKLVHLDRQVQIHCIFPHSQSDVIQLNAPDYDPDIDGEPDPVTDAQLLNAESVRSEHQPSEVLSDIHANEHDNVEQQ